MLQRSKVSLQSLIIILLVCMIMPLNVMAKDDDDDYDDDNYYYYNEETGYEAYIIDEDEWLTEREHEKLIEQMKGITEFTNVVFYADETVTYDSESYSERLSVNAMQDLFGDESAVIYHMDEYYDYIASQGSARKVITSAKARSIADNVYRYSIHDDQLYKAASVAFEQIEDLFNGRKIAEPMKYICNTFIAIFIALIVNYLIVSSKSKLKKATVNDIIMSSVNDLGIKDVNATHIRTDRCYSPRSSGSSGGHGGGGHGGGHSGGGHG